jgi:hypothetical protein
MSMSAIAVVTKWSSLERLTMWRTYYGRNIMAKR